MPYSAGRIAPKSTAAAVSRALPVVTRILRREGGGTSFMREPVE